MLSLTFLQFTLLLSTAAFAPEEPIFSAPPPPQTFSQSLQLERGWNLVSWYVVPPDQAPPLHMDDLFANTTWFEWDNYSTPTDKVGRYDASPQPSPQFYPQYGSSGGQGVLWTWNLRQAYPIYLESPAHFWEFADKPLYAPPTPPPDPSEDDFTPNPAWDDYTQVGIPNTTRTVYWYFISYPLRKQVKSQESSTVDWLLLNTDLGIIKDDEGNSLTARNPNAATLKYLKPGKGYYLGFETGATVENCPWFTDEGATPEFVPPDPKENQPSLYSGMHFQFKARTHWWYVIEIDSIAVSGSTPAVGDEIAVFDGNLCVGAVVFEGQYPISLAAWMDDIATPQELDGYQVDHEITFKWFDVSENQEITFVPPPQTQSMEEIDPYHPTHSGFGNGFCASRSLVNGIASINQLPLNFRLGQNYPNPFNASTVIPLELPQRSKIRIEVFNVKGQRVGNVYESVENAGYPKVYYNASQLSSGVYFCRVTAEGLERAGKFSGVSKLVLLK